MSDPFSTSHEAERRRAIREQSASHDKALREAATKRITAREIHAKRNPDGDIGYRMRPGFFEAGS